MLRLLRRSVSLPATYTAASSVRHASTSSIALRSYQEACVEACLDAFHTGIGRIGVSLPTGSGKTVVFLALLSRLRESQGNFGPKCALIIVPSIELAKQAKFLASVMHPDWRIEIEQGALTPASGTADLTIATYQTLMRGGRLYKYDPAKMLAVVVDEAHHAAAPSHRFILSHFDKTILPPSGYLDSHLLSTSSHHQVPIFGFSATFSRPDGLALGSVFEKIVFHKTLLDMIEDSWLCDIRVTTVHADIPLARIKVNSKDFCTTDLASVINTPSMNSLVVQAWIERAQNRKSTLVFCATQAHVYNLKSMFRRAGIDARSVLSSTPAKQRDELVNSFRQGKFPVLVNCAVLAEGVDVPNADCIVIARPTRSHNRYSQMVGRGLRLSPETGKTDCLVIDVANVHDSLGGVVTAPTLLGLNPAAFDDDASARRVVRRRPFRNLKEPDSSRFELRPSSEVAFTDYEKPFAKGCEPLETQKPLIDITSFEWVECADGVVALDCLGAGHIRIERGQRSGNATVYRAYYTSRQPESTRIRILDTECISDAVSGCDQFVMLKLQSQIDLAELNRDADWRAAPSTEQLKAWVNQEYNRMTLKRQDERVGLIELSYYGLTPEQINKSSAGEAANILTRMEHDELTQLTKTLFTEKRRSLSENNNFRPPPAYLLTGKQSSHLPWWRGWLHRFML